MNFAPHRRNRKCGRINISVNLLVSAVSALFLKPITCPIHQSASHILYNRVEQHRRVHSDDARPVANSSLESRLKVVALPKAKHL